MTVRTTVRLALLIWASTAVAACTHSPEAARTASDLFLDNLKGLCGKAFAGRVVSTDPADEAFAKERLLMHVRECTADGMRVPFHVGKNRSRTWVLTRTREGLRLKHDHRHEDGGEDKVTQYGGDTTSPGTAERQEFPVDAFSIALFERENLKASVTNVWALEMRKTFFAYELRRPNRFFRVEFDLTRPVAPPPPPWGARN
jgi:hypothetical protein